MASPPTARLIEVLRHHQLVDAAQLDELAGLIPSGIDLRGLARETVQRGLLTAYQATTILQGKATELVLGPYVVVDRLGEGGMGAVFKARHRVMNRLVALK